MWTQCQKSGQNTKVNRILENDNFGLSKLGIGYSIISTTIVSIFLTSTAHNWHVTNLLLIHLVLFLPRRFFVTGGLICRVFSVTCARQRLVPKYKHWIVMRKNGIYFIRWTYFRKCGHLLENVDIYSEMWTYTLKFGHIFLNVDKYSKMWTYT